MISEAPFFFSVTAVSVTLVGFSGLVAAFRRGDQLRKGMCFICALSPVARESRDGNRHQRNQSVGEKIALFAWRQHRMSIRVGVPQAVGAVAIDVALIALAVATIVLRLVGLYESLLLLLLARPMWDFVRVLRDTTVPDDSRRR